MAPESSRVLFDPRFTLGPPRPRPAVVDIRAVPAAFYVGRQFGDRPDSGFGNPVKIQREDQRDEACLCFAGLFTRELESRLHLHRIPPATPIGCWCAPKKCHGHVIAATLATLRLAGQPCPRCATPVRSWINRHDDTLYEYARCPACLAWHARILGSFTDWLATIWE